MKTVTIDPEDLIGLTVAQWMDDNIYNIRLVDLLHPAKKPGVAYGKSLVSFDEAYQNAKQALVAQ